LVFDEWVSGNLTSHIDDAPQGRLQTRRGFCAFWSCEPDPRACLEDCSSRPKRVSPLAVLVVAMRETGLGIGEGLLHISSLSPVVGTIMITLATMALRTVGPTQS
jgi:hypothetical protein